MKQSKFLCSILVCIVFVMLLACENINFSKSEGSEESSLERDHEGGEGNGESNFEGDNEGNERNERNEESNQKLQKDETYDVVRKGVRLILTYDAKNEVFSGTVHNSSVTIANNVRVEIHLSNGTELGPNSYGNLNSNEQKNVSLNATQQNFTTWSAHAEVD